jgi:hypothetical protein
VIPTSNSLRRGCGGRASSPAGGLGETPRAVSSTNNFSDHDRACLLPTSPNNQIILTSSNALHAKVNVLLLISASSPKKALKFAHYACFVRINQIFTGAKVHKMKAFEAIAQKTTQLTYWQKEQLTLSIAFISLT